MINITAAAAEQIQVALQQHEGENLVLRIAARRMPDGGIDHTMGFDQTKPTDTLLTVNDIELAISADSKILTPGLILDFVEFEPGNYRFIFNNPNDAAASKGDAPLAS